MVDCRPAAGAAHELPHAPTNGGPPPDNHHNQHCVPHASGGAVAGAPELARGVGSPPAARAATPAAQAPPAPMPTYPGGMASSMSGFMGGAGAGVGAGVGVGGNCGPYSCKPLVWCAPHAPHAHPPPHAPPPPVNPHVYKSVQANGADLPMNDIPTLRYFFNLGVDCMWSSYGPPQPPPPRHYSPRDLAQDMQQISLHERNAAAPNHSGGEHKHKPQDKPPLQAKGNGQRALLGPRFKRGNNQDGQNNHNQNKGHNNMANKGPNNRRNSHSDRAQMPPGGPVPQGPPFPEGGECPPEPQMVSLPYIPYPPPIYPISYYPLENDPNMMGMMGGMGYVGYEEGMEYATPLPYYPHYAPPPHPQHPPHPPHPHMHPHPEHK